MITRTVKIRGTRGEMRQAIRNLPAILSGKMPDRYGLGRLFKSYFAYFWFKQVHAQYLVKTSGKPDDLGQVWAPISPAWKARKRKEGRSTKIGLYKERLIAAVAPGVVAGRDYRPPNTDQRVTYHHGAMDFKIKVPYTKFFHKKRPIWPESGGSLWVKTAARLAMAEVLKAVAQNPELMGSKKK